MHPWLVQPLARRGAGGYTTRPCGSAMKLAPVVRVAPSKRPPKKAGWWRLLFFWRHDEPLPPGPAPVPHASQRPKPLKPQDRLGHPGPSGSLYPARATGAPPRPNPFLPSIPLSTAPPRTRSEAPTPVLPPPPAVPRITRSRAPVAVAASAPAPPTVPIRAVAVAHEAANAVGTVELSCAADGLRIRFVRISTWSEGYVPYPATVSQSIVVPYHQVARVVMDRDGLVQLVVDPSVTPYNRLVLAGLIRDAGFDHRSSHRRRARIERDISLAALLAWVPIALAVSAALPSVSPVLVAALSLTVAGIVHTLRRDIASRLVLFNAASVQVRDELLAELSLRLGPGRVREQTAVPMPLAAARPADAAEPEPEPGSLRGLMFTAGVAAAVAVVAILVGRSLLTAAPEPAAVHDPWISVTGSSTLAAVQVPREASSSIQPDPVKPKVILPPCECERADSPLWKDGVPRLAVLARNRPGPTSPERPSMYPEIAVVNNSADDLKDIVLTVDFLLGGGEGRKPRVLDTKDLFWEGRLGPGKAVKWRVKGRGDDYRVKSFVTGMIGDPGVKPAPADVFFELSTTAHTPAVRVHGAKMLAWLGDHRVAQALEKLRRDNRDDFVDVLDQIAEASRPLRVCAVRANPATDAARVLRVEACVFNAGAEAVEAPLVAATSRLADQVFESRWTVDATIAPGTGVLTSGTVDMPEGDTAGLQVQMAVEQ